MIEGRDFIKCPYCSARMTDLWDFDSLKGDGDCAEVECDTCEKEFIISIFIDVQYEACKKEKPISEVGEIL